MKIEIVLPDNAVCGHLVYITTESGEDGKPTENAINAGSLNGLEDGTIYYFNGEEAETKTEPKKLPTIVNQYGDNAVNTSGSVCTFNL